MSLPQPDHIDHDGFRLRGLGSSRIDAFSDVVFGFALTLLVVSLEVPKTFAQLIESLHGLLPFAICFTLLMMAWYSHYKYFRRFGTHDLGTILINSALLFVVMFYVYPLKFLFTFVTTAMAGGKNVGLETNHQLAQLMVLYGVGYASVYLLVGALYGNAWRQRRHLGLNPLEELLTRTYIVEALGVAGVGIAAGLVAVLVPEEYAGLTGWVYCLVALFKMAYGRWTRKRIVQHVALHKLTETPH